MKAMRLVEEKGPAGMKLADVPEPALGPQSIRVRVRASAINRADLLQTLGMYPAPPDAPADIPGLEYAGEVIETGPQARRFQIGDRVMGLVAGGAFAEQVCVHEREAVRIPDRLDFAQAAAVPEAFITAYDALVLQGRMSAGEHVLIHAASSGVGTAAAQLVRAFGAHAIGTGRTRAKLERLAAFGVEHTIELGAPPDFSSRVRALTPGGADLALDLIGGDSLGETLRAMAPRGRVMLVGTLAGASADFPISVAMTRRLAIVGTVLRARPLEEKIALARAFEKQVVPLLGSGAIAPVIDGVVPMTDAAAALEAMGRNEGIGKRVLAWP
jgi:NADPH2:quinone reductase